MKFDKIIEENSKLDAFKQFRDEELKAQKAKKLRSEVVKFYYEFDDFMADIYKNYFEDKDFVRWLQNVWSEEISASDDAADDVSNIRGFLRVLTASPYRRTDAQEELSNTLKTLRSPGQIGTSW
jgi:hypothetical protein